MESWNPFDALLMFQVRARSGVGAQCYHANTMPLLPYHRYVPEVIEELSAARVLTTELIHGVRLF